ncbi:unnamed protein product [Caenorhabditis brenneri]
MDKNQSGPMPNPKKHELAMAAPFQHLSSNFQPLSNDEIEYFAGNTRSSGPNPNSQQRVFTNQGSLPAPMQTDPAWFNHVAPPTLINHGQLRAGSVTSQQTNSSQSSPGMPSPDSVTHHSVQTSPEFHSAHNSDNGNFVYGPGFHSLGNPSAPQHLMPQTYNIMPEVGFNPMVHNRIVTDSAANWMEEAPIMLERQGTVGAPINRKREFGLNNDRHESYKMHRSSQLHGTRFEGTGGAPWNGSVGDYNYQFRQYDAGVPWNGGIGDYHNQFRQYDTGIPWQWNYRKQCYGAQKHGTFDNHLPGTTPQFTMPRQGGTYGPIPSHVHGPNFGEPAQNFGTAGAPWQGNHNSNISQLSSRFSDATIALHVSVERANQAGPQDQVLAGNYPRNVQNGSMTGSNFDSNQTNSRYYVPDQNTNNSAGNNFNFNLTNLRHHGLQIGRPTRNMPVHTQQWIPDNNDNLGLMDLDWEYPKGICNFGTYSNHVGVIDPWMEIKAERALAPPISAPDFHQMSNNEGESLSQEAEAYKERLAARKSDDPNLTREQQEKEAAKREANRGYTKTYKEKTEATRESYKNEAELLPKKILRPQQYRRNIEKNMLFVQNALKKRYPDFLSVETEGYLCGKRELCNKFTDQKKWDSELTAADTGYVKEVEKFIKADKAKPTAAPSQRTRAKDAGEHWENVGNVLDSQWTLLRETKLAGLATLYVQRTMPTVISKLRPIFTDVRDQCYQTMKGKKGFEDFMEFLKKHRNLFMVRRNSLPSGSKEFMRRNFP